MERTVNNADTRRAASSFDALRLKETFFLCLSHWRWFALSLLVTLGGAVLYLKTTPPVYVRTASILIKSDDKKSGTEEPLKELGIIQTPSNLTNEMLFLKTGTMASEIVSRLKLNVEYLRQGTFHKEVLYGTDLPVTVSFIGMPDNAKASLHLELSAAGRVTLSDIRCGKEEVGSVPPLGMGDTVSLRSFKVAVHPSPYYRKGTACGMDVVRSGLRGAVASVQGRISATLRDKNSTIIDVSYHDVSTGRAEDILNTLIAVYNENWVKDRNQRTISTNEFIKERLGVIEQELGNVDQDISNYKSTHLVPDVQQAGSMAMARANEVEQQSNTLSNQLYMARYIRNYLTDGRHENQLLPSNSGISNPSIERQIGEYNSVLLQRNNHLANSSAQNPLVMDLEQHLAMMRSSIIQSLDNELTMLQTQQRSVSSAHSQVVSKIASNPAQAKYLLSVERQQKVKESLYLFLLQKREENELSKAFTAYNTQLIEPPHGSMAPAEPVRNNVLLFAFALGLLLPGGTLFLRESMNTTVRGRKDLEAVKVPFVGEIPFAGKKGASGLPGRRGKAAPQVLVVEKGRDMMNEAFRVVRTNLEFMLGFDDSHHVVMLTSINPGSGKTFVTANLSAALGIKGKKVLAVDLDLRKGSLSEYVGRPRLGVSNYLSGQVADYRALVAPHDHMDILPCGTIPPNPTELLFSPRFPQMVEEARKEYDYVFIDCPPVEIVADAAIIGRHADLTLFVVRSQLMERAMLPDIEGWYEEKKYRNLSLLLNGTVDAVGRYGYHKYGYRYGYH